MRRRPSGDLPEIRQRLADHYRASVARSGYRHAGNGAVSYSPFPARIEALEAGEPLEVYGWELRKYRPGIDAQARYRVDADGTVAMCGDRAAHRTPGGA